METINRNVVNSVRFWLQNKDCCGEGKFYNTVVESCYSGIRWTPSYDSWINVKVDGDVIATLYPLTGRLWLRNLDTFIKRRRANAILCNLIEGYRIAKVGDKLHVVDSRFGYPVNELFPEGGYVFHGVI
jgi:hypothetical protein